MLTTETFTNGDAIMSTTYTTSPYYYITTYNNGIPTYDYVDYMTSSNSTSGYSYYRKDPFQLYHSSNRKRTGTFDPNHAEAWDLLHKDLIADMKIRLERYNADEEKEERLKNHSCKYCWYVKQKSTFKSPIPNLSQCDICEKKIDSKFKEVESFCCDECAEKYHICQCCGAKLD